MIYFNLPLEFNLRALRVATINLRLGICTSAWGCVNDLVLSDGQYGSVF